MTPLQQFRALPSELQKMVAVTALEYLLGSLEGERRDESTLAAATGIELALDLVRYEGRPTFAMLSEQAMSQVESFLDASLDSASDLLSP